MLPKLLQRTLFTLILISYLLVGGLFAIQTPDWQAPDEPAHYNVVRQIVTDTAYPVIEAGDWNNRYLETLKSNRFAPALLSGLNTVQYEDHQPPLYYLLQAPIFALTGGSLHALRIASVLMGTIIVVMAYLIGREMFPGQPQIALGAMALVGLLPQHVHILASVNNDALGEAVVAVALWLMVLHVKGSRAPVWLLGVVLGIGLLTKTTTYFLVVPAAMAIWLRWALRPDGERKPVRLVHLWLVMGVIALLVGGGWWLRNIGTYGMPDFLGLAAHDSVVIGQLRTDDLISDIGNSAYVEQFLRTTMRSYWGQFGWMAVPLEARIYLGIQILIVFSLIGLILRLGIRVMRPRDPAFGNDLPNEALIQDQLWIIMGTVLLLSMGAFLYYNSEFVQFQGRYMYPGLIPFALALVLGVDAWRHWLLGRFTWSRWLTVLPFWAFALVDVYVLMRHIIPALSPPIVG
ncbi:MAG: glycosyltransferase family 39 protein [Anaerolineae bacterium]|nr:glycosyltransferase family 39 protein [Anaerolineae bacterium]